MKSVLSLSIFLLFASFLVYSQCPTNSITLNTQADVNDFPTNYPGCTILDENLTISGNDIVDLSPLAVLTQIEKSLYIENNPLLTELNGLHNITSISTGQDLVIDNNPMLTDLTGFTALEDAWDISIRNCNNLINMNGMDNLQSLRSLIVEDCPSFESFTDLSGVTLMSGGILLTNLPSLISLSEISGTNIVNIIAMNNCDLVVNAQGLESLTDTRFVEFSNNDGLISLDGLSGINEETWTVYLDNNPNLTSLHGLSNLSSLSNFLQIRSNDSLESLDGLENLTNDDDFFSFQLLIEDNPVLNDISALANIDEFKLEEVTITGNTSLSECAILSICKFLDLSGSEVEISNNASGCNSVPEVQNACDMLLVDDEVLDRQIYITPAIIRDLMTIHAPEAVDIIGVDIISNDGKLLDSFAGNMIDLSGLPGGVYFVRILTGSGYVTKRIIKL